MLDMQVSSRASESAITFPAGNGQVQGTLFLPPAAPRAAVVINGAVGVPHRFYRAFAAWLSEEQGLAVLTYDYRDFGASCVGLPKRSQLTMTDWALVDQPAARTEMRKHLPGVPIWVIGHSFGAMVMPLQDGIEDIERMITVASGLIILPDHAWPYRALATLFWYGHVPPIVRLLGYVPSKISGFGTDIPGSVYWQWRKWCTDPHSYYPELGEDLPEPHWSDSGAPVDLIAFSDDPIVRPVGLQRLAGLYGLPRSRIRILEPSDFGLTKVGHIGPFARANKAVWPALIATQ
ncbi:MAG: alpha/beta fold hydrolase [Arenibacterium sp.]